MEGHEELKGEVVKKQKSGRETAFKVVTAIVAVFILICLGIFAYENPEFPLKWILIIGALVLIIALILFFGFSIYRRVMNIFAEKEAMEKQPKVASEEQILEKLRKTVENSRRMNHIKSYKAEKPHNVGGNMIYEYFINLLYKDEDAKGTTAYVLINANYINEPAAFLPGDITKYELTKLINGMSKNPDREPDTKKAKVFNPLTNTYIESEEKTHQKAPEQKEEKPKGDLD